MSKLITNIISIKLRKLNERYKEVYDAVTRLQERRHELELEKLRIERKIFSLNRELDEIEEAIVIDVYGLDD